MTDEAWDGYVTLAGADPLAVDFDEAAAAPDVQAALPALLRVEREVVAPDEQGQPSPAEARLLATEEDQLTALLARHGTGGRVVARATCRGTRELVVALPTTGAADYVLRKWRRKLERESEVSPLEDGWSFVEAHLLPGPAERAWMAARDAVVDALEAGADPEATFMLKVEGRGPAEFICHRVPLDPFAIAAVLEELPTGTSWSLERT